MTTSIPLSAKSLRVGMTVLAYTERSPFVIRKITPIKDGKRVRLFWKGHKFTYWDVYLENVIPVATNEQGRVTFDKEVMGDSPEFEVKKENGLVTAVWVNSEEDSKVTSQVLPVDPLGTSGQVVELQTQINSLDRQMEDADREITDLNSQVARLNGLLESEERMVSALQKLVLTKFTKEELLSMALGRQAD